MILYFKRTGFYLLEIKTTQLFKQNGVMELNGAVSFNIYVLCYLKRLETEVYSHR